MPAVAAKVNRYSMRTGQFANSGRRNRIGFVRSPRLTDGCDVINIYR
jgi:hypothetical protein